MNVKSIEITEGKVVTVDGRLDTLTAPDFERTAMSFLSDDVKALILDLSDLEYISSAGLRSILAVAKKASGKKIGLSLCGMKGVVEEVFSISGFESFLPVYSTRKEALEAM